SNMKLQAAILMTICTLLFSSVLAAEPEQPRTISTSGEATVYVVPDEVVISLGVASFDESMESARKTNEDESGKLIKAVRGMGLDDKEIQTEDMQVEIRYKTEDTVAVRGYFVRRQYLVTLKDAKRTEELVTTALKNGANHLFGVKYRTSELRKHRDQ